MTRHSPALSLNSKAVVTAVDERVIHFEETRFRYHALPFQESLRDLAVLLSSEISVSLSSSVSLSKESEASLNTKTFCVFDFMDLKMSSRTGFLQVQWLPLVVFVGGTRVFCLHAAYDKAGVKLKGITLFLKGKDDYTTCTTLDAAAKVGVGYLRNYLTEKSHD